MNYHNSTVVMKRILLMIPFMPAMMSMAMVSIPTPMPEHATAEVEES